MGATPLHLVRTIVAQQYRNAGRQEGQKEGTKCHCLWMDWMDPLPRKKKAKDTGEDKEGEGGSHCHISPTTSHSSARGNPALIKTLINKAACCRGGGWRADKKFISVGMLRRRFSLMSQFDSTDKRGGSRLCRKHLMCLKWTDPAPSHPFDHYPVLRIKISCVF